jgi:hypothetical protein
LVADPRWAPDTKTDWPTDCDSDFDLYRTFEIRAHTYGLGYQEKHLSQLQLHGGYPWCPHTVPQQSLATRCSTYVTCAPIILHLPPSPSPSLPLPLPTQLLAQCKVPQRNWTFISAQRHTSLYNALQFS